MFENTKIEGTKAAKFLFFILLLISNPLLAQESNHTSNLNSGLCRADESSLDVKLEEKPHFPKEVEVNCEYYCKRKDGSIEHLNASYIKMALYHDQFECEGVEFGEVKDFLPQVSQSKELKLWAEQHGRSVKEFITEKDKKELRRIGMVLYSTKSIIVSEAGRILLDMANDSEEASDLLEHYSNMIDSGHYQTGRFQTVDQWVLNYLSHLVIDSQ